MRQGKKRKHAATDDDDYESEAERAKADEARKNNKRRHVAEGNDEPRLTTSAQAITKGILKPSDQGKDKNARGWGGRGVHGFRNGGTGRLM